MRNEAGEAITTATASINLSHDQMQMGEGQSYDHVLTRMNPLDMLNNDGILFVPGSFR